MKCGLFLVCMVATAMQAQHTQYLAPATNNLSPSLSTHSAPANHIPPPPSSKSATLTTAPLKYTLCPITIHLSAFNTWRLPPKNPIPPLPTSNTTLELNQAPSNPLVPKPPPSGPVRVKAPVTESIITISTPNQQTYIPLEPYGVSLQSVWCIHFRIKSSSDVHIGLYDSESSSSVPTDMYEIVLGGWSNTKSVIRMRAQGPNLDTVLHTVLSNSEFKPFWLSWGDDGVKVGTGTTVDTDVFLNLNDTSYDVKYIAIYTAFGSTGEWEFAVADTYTVETLFVREEDSVSEIVISRLDSSNQVSFKASLLDGTAKSIDGDFMAVSDAPVTFLSGTATVSLLIQIGDDMIFDPWEYFRIRLHDFPNICVDFERNIDIVDTRESTINISTPNQQTYIPLEPYGVCLESVSHIQFRLKSSSDVHIGLYDSGSSSNVPTDMYEIVLGGWSNTKSVIRMRAQGPNLDTVLHTVLSNSEFKPFWVSWGDDGVKVGAGTAIGTDPFLNLNDNSYDVKYIAIYTAYGSTGEWEFAVAVDTYTVETLFVREEDSVSEIVISRLDSSRQVSFKASLLDGTAKSIDGDFMAVSDAPLTFLNGTATVSLLIQIGDDMIIDPGEYFKIRLHDFCDNSEDVEHNIDIVDTRDISLDCKNHYAIENRNHLEITLSRQLEDSAGSLNITVEIYDSEALGSRAPPSNFSDYEYKAINGTDFLEFTRTITMEHNELTATVMVDLLDDHIDEGPEPFIIEVTGDHITNCTSMGIILNDDAPKPFHCGRNGQDCQNGGTCDANGECACPMGFILDDCALVSATPPGCDNSCESESGGVCQIADGTISCHCKPGFAGEFCNYTAYNTQCNQNTFGLCVRPYGDFQGSIYMDGYANVSECNFIKVDPVDPADFQGIQDWCDGYFLELNYTGTVGDVQCAVITPVVEGSTQTYISTAILQYSENGPTVIDEAFTSFCRVDTNGVGISTNVVDVAVKTSYLNKQVAVGEAAAIDFSFKVGNSDLDDLDSIDLGTHIVICSDVQQAEAWACTRIKQVKFDNNRAASDYREGIIYNEGCYYSTYLSAIIYGAKWETGNTNKKKSCMTISTFCFQHDVSLEVFEMRITVTADLPDPGSCNPFTCSSKRKRQATGGEEKVTRFIKVRTPKRNPDTEQNELLNIEEETVNLTFLKLPIVIGATVGGTLLAMSMVIIGFIACRRRRGKDPFDM